MPVYIYSYIFDAPVAAIAQKYPSAFQTSFLEGKRSMIGCHWLLAVIHDNSGEEADAKTSKA
jgi:hypothetical protein